MHYIIEHYAQPVIANMSAHACTLLGGMLVSLQSSEIFQTLGQHACDIQ